MKLTVVRLLKELKTLQSRFEKGCDDLEIVSVKQNGKLLSPFSYMAENDFKERAKGQLESVNALIRRICLIKNTIDRSNSITKVKIGDREMTIQEVLNEKKYIPLKKKLLLKLKDQKQRAITRIADVEEENNDKLDKLLQSDSGTDGKKRDAEDNKNRIAGVMNILKPELVDPCNIDESIAKMEEWIDTFTSDVDIVLSESNCSTEIEIPD